MAATITWTVTEMVCHPSIQEYTNVVLVVHWNCAGVQHSYSSQMNGYCNIPGPTDSFTPYDQLTQTQVLEWIWANGVDQAAIESYVQASIDEQANPPVVMPLPWAA